MGKKKNRKKHKAPILSVPKPTQPKEVSSESTNVTYSTQVMDNTRQSEQYGPSTEKRDSPRIEGENSQKAQSIRPQNSKDRRWLWSGLLGGGIVLLVCLFIAIVRPGYRVSAYYINEDPSLLTRMLSTDISTADSITIEAAVQEETKRRKDIIEDLLDQKVIVSSEEFASNLTGYYNTLVEVLAGILIILNIIGYFSLRSNANSALEQKQKELDDVINNIDKKLEKNLEEVFTRNSVVKERIESIFGNLYDESAHLTDEEWEKLHLLLAKYKKEERLEEINAKDEQNDGEIIN